jgi:hypothetical protein
MQIVNWFSSLIKGLFGYIGAFFAGKLHEKKTRAEKERDAYKKKYERKVDLGVRTKSDIKRLLQRRINRKKAENDP